jgi:hydroxyacylglutathione hydrolase
LKLFKNAQIYLSIDEEKMINGEESKFFLMSNRIDSKEYRLVRDGDSLNFNGIKVKCILTPGHTSGSMCWLINDKYLFTGDAISLKDGKIGKPIDFFTMNPEMALKSMEKITTIPGAQYIFTSHNGYTDDYKNAVKDWKPKK